MKSPITLLLMAAGILSMVACSNQTTQLSQKDSLDAGKKYLALHPEAVQSINLFTTKDNPFRFVPQDSLENMRKAYLANPVNMVDTKGNAITGFVMDSADLPQIVAAASKLKTIGFHFGIRNFGTYQQAGEKPIYTLMIIPIGLDWKPYPQAITNPLGAVGGYDFVDPCPGGLGCPPPPTN